MASAAEYRNSFARRGGLVFNASYELRKDPNTTWSSATDGFTIPMCYAIIQSSQDRLSQESILFSPTCSESCNCYSPPLANNTKASFAWRDKNMGWLFALTKPETRNFSCCACKRKQSPVPATRNGIKLFLLYTKRANSTSFLVQWEAVNKYSNLFYKFNTINA